MEKILEVTRFQLSKMFDEVLLCRDDKKSPSIFCANSKSSISQISSSLGSNGKHRVLRKVEIRVKI